jgi:hypothetical protein
MSRGRRLIFNTIGGSVVALFGAWALLFYHAAAGVVPPAQRLYAQEALLGPATGMIHAAIEWRRGKWLSKALGERLLSGLGLSCLLGACTWSITSGGAAWAVYACASGALVGGTLGLIGLERGRKGSQAPMRLPGERGGNDGILP